MNSRIGCVGEQQDREDHLDDLLGGLELDVDDEHGSCPAVRTTARRVTWSGGLDRWVGLSAPTGWTAGAHVPAIQLSSLPLDEWHYMRHNETVRVRLRPAR